MPKIRVLVVDDSVVFRRMVSHELDTDPALEVVGTAANGKIALGKLTQVNPDVVVLDVEMPELDGLATLREIRKTHPRLPVIMFSALTERGAAATLDALALGATGYFAKPNQSTGLDDSLRIIRASLVPEIKAICANVLAGLPGASPASGVRRLPTEMPPLSRTLAPFNPGTRRASTWCASAPRPAGRRRWPTCSRRCPPTYRSRCWSCSTCRRRSPGCWPSG